MINNELWQELVQAAGVERLKAPAAAVVLSPTERCFHLSKDDGCDIRMEPVEGALGLGLTVRLVAMKRDQVIGEPQTIGLVAGALPLVNGRILWDAAIALAESRHWHLN
jgi:hypothetical protein